MVDHTQPPRQESFGARRARLPVMRYPEELPICRRKDEIVAAVEKHQVLIVTGDTGTGKSTQLPKMCLDAGRGSRGLIGCTQPRRVAAVAVARRIAEEMGEEIGAAVAYKIRFDEKCGPQPLIKVMTDGILLQETQHDRLLRRYDTIIVDEAHERSLNIDLLLGLLRTILPKRRDLKVIVTSATLETEKFARAFNEAPIINISGRLHPVETRWRPLAGDDDREDSASYVEGAVAAVERIVARAGEPGPGDILIFMPTEQDIRETCALLTGRFGTEKLILPMFSRLSWGDQQQVFRPAERQKIVVATNVAETSLTIPNIRYVIDTGLARIAQYNPRTRTAGLPVVPISRSSADQRRGRCGRVGEGVCIRLYDEESYLSRPPFTPPEIMRANLTGVILKMLFLNVEDVYNFPFLDPPSKRLLHAAMDDLRELGAVGRGEPPALTDTGRFMARLPIDPRFARMIMAALSRGCVEEILIITAALSIADPRERPPEQTDRAAAAHARFQDPASDFITLLNIWKRYHEIGEETGSQGALRRFCRDNFLSWRRMREWQDLHRQLRTIVAGELNRNGSNLENSPDRTPGNRGSRPEAPDALPPGRRDSGHDEKYALIHKAVLSGFLSGIAVRKERNIYTAPKGRTAMIFPGSTLFKKAAPWIVAAEWVETSRLFARTAAAIEPEWIEEVAGPLCRTIYSDPFWNRERGEVQASAQISLFGIVIVPRRVLSYGRIDPVLSREIFIREGIMAEALKNEYPFLVHNAGVMAKVRLMENKLRRHNWLWNEEAVFSFYQQRLPLVSDERALRRHIRQIGNDLFLHMQEGDILLEPPADRLLQDWPDEVCMPGLRVSLSYNFSPGSEDDGVTVQISPPLLAAGAADRLEVAVPGLRREAVRELLRVLPKSFRRRLPPLAELTEALHRRLDGQEGPLPAALRILLKRHYDLEVPADLWRSEELPVPVRLRYLVTDDAGRRLASGRDLPALRKLLLPELQSTHLENARREWERDDIQQWDFGDLPAAIPLGAPQQPVGHAYPALRYAPGVVSLRLFDNPAAADAAHRRGVAALYEKHFAASCRYLKKNILPPEKLKEYGDFFGGSRKLQRLLYDKTILDLFSINIRNKDSFYRYAEEVKGKILPHGQEVTALATPVLAAKAQVSSCLERLEKQYGRRKAHREYLDLLRGELNRLVPEDFLLRYPDERIKELSRFLRGLIIRAERGMLNLEKAREKTGAVESYLEQWRRLVAAETEATTPERRQAREDLFWFIEEYKISLFAQELKTSQPVSPKRLQEKIDALREMP
ncbi:MAG TPA: ATP-dependent RNA helicase HrpA [Syntrophales bacterium]|nr:ATP-dependent RNA helicase HrpA [Syntrophales bacterium]